MDAIGLSEDSLGESGSTPYEILRDIVTVLNGADPDRVSDLNTFQEFVELMMDQGILSEPRFRGRLLGGN